MRSKAILLVLLFFLPLSGCVQSNQPENQAIAISLGVDRNAPGGLEVSILAPRLHGAGQGGDGSSGDEYALFCATGGSFSEAMEILRASVPLTLNLSQLKFVVFSQEIAMDSAFSDLVEEMFLAHRLYNAAYCAVSLGPAQDMLKAQQSDFMGVRLSSAIIAAMEKGDKQGCIPDAHFTDLYYGLHSIYGYPIAILAATSDGIHTKLIENGRMGDALPGALPRTGENRNEYSGTALFSNGAMVGTLSSLETQWMRCLRGETRAISYTCDGCPVSLSPVLPIKVRIDPGENLQIDIEGRFSISGKCNTELLQEMISGELAGVIAKCQSISCDPFLFAQRAASCFADNQTWEAYNYGEHFRGATICLKIECIGEHGD